MNKSIYGLVLFSLFFQSCSHFSHRKVVLADGEVKAEHLSVAKKYMITSQGKYSSKAGEEIINLGGNIADAAVAISFTISVERPQSTGIGGGGFLLYHDKSFDIPVAIDFREKAPLTAQKDMYLNSKGKEIKNKSRDGIFSVGVPGLVAGLIEFHNEYGVLPLYQVLRPAIRLATKGFSVNEELARALEIRKDVLKKYPASKKIFFNDQDEVLKYGDLLVQRDLAKTLETIAKKGRDGFYRGQVARAIVKESRRLGGLISTKDLKSYNVRYRQPVHGTYKGHDIYSMSPPSSGGVHIIQILNILEPMNLNKLGHDHPKSIHLTATAMQQAFADRASYLGDADFVKVPIDGLISKSYAQILREGIPANKALNSKTVRAGDPLPYESPETTHFTIMDDQGNTISSTQTINGYFGSGVTVPGTGIVLNNEMDDFATQVGASNLFGAIGGDKNLVAPEKRPLSSMSPTIVLKDNETVLSLGTPSGTRILTCVAQTILNYLEHDMSLYDSVSTIRYHHQWMPDKLWIESPGFSPKTESELVAMGHQVERKNLGCRIQGIAKEGSDLIGVSDPRGAGLSLGK